MTPESWSEICDQALANVYANLPEDADDDMLRVAFRNAYPFPKVEAWSLRAWLFRLAAWKEAKAAGKAAPDPFDGDIPLDIDNEPPELFI